MPLPARFALLPVSSLAVRASVQRGYKRDFFGFFNSGAPGRCDFDIVEGMIDSAVFRRTYYMKKPLLIRSPDTAAIRKLQALFAKDALQECCGDEEVGHMQ